MPGIGRGLYESLVGYHEGHFGMTTADCESKSPIVVSIVVL